MPFWSSETLKERIPRQSLVEPFALEAIVHCAYELAMGSQAVISSKPKIFRKKSRTVLEKREPLVIPPGQFGLLVTEEKITVPDDAIAFISIRAGVKFDGLVNISGFHVDPGFSGRLKFSVYNAGQKEIVICRGDRIFMIWYASLDRTTTDLYSAKKSLQNEISALDLSRAAGEVTSPSQLKRDLDELKHSMTNWKWMLGIFISLAASALVAFMVLVLRTIDKPDVKEQQPKATTSSSQVQPSPISGAMTLPSVQTQPTEPETRKTPETKPASGPKS